MSKILLIDDSEDVRQLVQDVLGGEHEVLVAESWSKAFPYISEGGIDLVLLDVNLPGLKGDEIASMMARDDRADGPSRVVLFSAMDRAELRRRVRSCGADGFIEKSFEPAVLRFHVGKMLRGTRRVRSLGH